MGARERIRSSTYPNGLTLVTEELPALQGLSLGVWVKVGTRHESRREAGASHFLEHMLFKGTRDRTALQIAREVDAVGGEFNAFTSREQTCFHLLLSDRHLKLGSDLLTDVLLYSEFDPVELERERQVILQEIAMVVESPEEIAHDYFFERIFRAGTSAHGIGKPILGTRSSINRMRRAELLKFFHAHYRPDQLVVSVAGAVTHAQARRAFAQLGRSTRWPGRTAKSVAPALVNAEKPTFRPGGYWVNHPTEQTHLLWGVPAPSFDSRDRLATWVLNNHLGGGMSSRLFQEVREKRGLSYTVYSHYSPFTDSGLLLIYLAAQSSKIVEALEVIDGLCEEMRTQMLSDHDLEIARENLKGTLLLQADSAESRMTALARGQLLMGKPLSLRETCAELDALTPRDLLRVSRKILAPTKAAILGLGRSPSAALRKRLGLR